MTDAPYFGEGCHGLGEEHCCHLGKFGVCEFLGEYEVPGRRWDCRLFTRYFAENPTLAGQAVWALVHEDLEYIEKIKPKLREIGFPAEYLCGDWPQNIEDYMVNVTGNCCYSQYAQPEQHAKSS